MHLRKLSAGALDRGLSDDKLHNAGFSGFVQNEMEAGWTAAHICQLDVARLQASTCHLGTPSQSREVLAVTTTMWTIASVAVLLRFLSIYHGRSTHKEDIIVAVAVCLTWGLGIIYGLWKMVPCQASFNYVKKSSPKFSLGKPLTSGKVYAGEIFYVVILCLAKSSLIFFYLRVFPGRTFRNVSYAVLGFTIVSSLIITFLTAFSCRPVALFWNKDIKHGTCLDVTALGYANSGFAVAQDFLILALPLSMLPNLQIKLGRKLGVAFMVLLGSFGWVASIVRLRALSVFGQSSDPTWDYVPLVSWTAVELAVSVVCGCIPAIRALLVRYFPHMPLLASEQSSSSAGRRNHGEAKQDTAQKRAGAQWPSSAAYAEIDGNFYANSEATRLYVSPISADALTVADVDLLYRTPQDLEARLPDPQRPQFAGRIASNKLSDLALTEDVRLESIRHINSHAGGRGSRSKRPFG
ncbi:putative CFEM domain-containing protein [Seiridium cardinale]|uniref:CFEM domain-containing protein n=1 Tax=Seiridium cardinale TaxID=138064 RepID=A0ABR2X6L5_9PEZI